MTGSDNGQGSCRKACGACEMCEDDDRECYNRNRDRGGYIKLDNSEFMGLFG